MCSTSACFCALLNERAFAAFLQTTQLLAPGLHVQKSVIYYPYIDQNEVVQILIGSVNMRCTDHD